MNAATRTPARRGGLRAGVVIIAVLVLVVLAALAGELWARNKVSDDVSSQVGQSLGIESELEFGASPVLPALFTGSIGSVDLVSDGTPHPDADTNNPDVAAMTQLQPRLDFNGEGVTIEDEALLIDALNGTITVNEESMVRVANYSISGGEGGGLLEGLASVESISTDPAAGTLAISVGGIAEATVRPEVQDGRLLLEPEGGNLMGIPIPSELLGGLSGVLDSAVNTLPEGLVMAGVEVTESGMDVLVEGTDVRMDREGG